MIFRTIVLGFAGLIAVNCQNSLEQNKSQSSHLEKNNTLDDNEYIYWVNSYKVSCTGVAPQMCLQIQKSDKIQPGKWKRFYSTIEGFHWEPGFVYQLQVKEEQIPTNQVPADGSNLKYTLVKELKKELDPIIKLHDIWALTSMNGKEWESKTLERPTLEIHLTQQTIMGTDGCNQYMGTLTSVSSDLIQFGELAGTKKACPDMDLSAVFYKTMSKVQGYTLNQLTLTLTDTKGNDLLRFRKVD